MTRGNLMILVVLTLGLVGMFFWTLDISQRHESAPADSGAPPHENTSDDIYGRLERLERKVQELELSGQASRTDLAELGRDIREIREMKSAAGLAAAELGDNSATIDLADAPAEAKLKAAVESVLAQREAEDRKQRYVRMAGFMSSRLLSKIQATDDQKKQFETTMMSYMEGRDEVREKYSGAEADTQAREAAMNQLTEDRNAKLLTIFGAADYAKIEEQMNRFGRRDGGRGGPPRGR